MATRNEELEVETPSKPETSVKPRAVFMPPAKKSPFESRATMVETVFAFVALDVTVNVAAPEPL